MKLTRCGRSALLLWVSLAGVSTSARPQATTGLTYTFVLTGHGLNAEGKANDFEMTATARVLGDREWIQFRDPPDREVGSTDVPQVPNKPMYFGQGAYYLARRGVDTLTVVSPTKKKYAELPGATAAGKMFGNMLSVQLSNPAISIERVQPDTMIDGLHARHWRVTDDHTLKTSLLGISSSQRVRSIADYYFVAEMATDFNPFLQPERALVSAGSQDYGTKLDAALGLMDHGVPALLVWRTTSTGNRGQGTSVLIDRVTQISTGDASAGSFVVPVGFQKTGEGGIPAVRAGLPERLTTAAGVAGSPLAPSSSGNSTSGKAKNILGKMLKLP